MTIPEDLSEKIQATGFSCTGCACCCKRDGSDSGRVMVSRDEVRAIVAATGLDFTEIAEPYPERILDRDGGTYTLGWCLRQNGSSCRFLSSGRCTIYASRPWICRTYPFMLDGDELRVSECAGTGKEVSLQESRHIARDLVRRKQAEEEEAQRIRRVIHANRIPPGSFVVVDSDGIQVIDG